MSKISELGKITAGNTKSRDLFVTVSLDLGEQGTKNITRAELAKSIQLEEFDNLTVTGGTATNFDISDSTLTNVNLVNPNINVGDIEQFVSPIADEDFLLLKNISSNTVVAFSYSDLTNEFANTYRKANKIYVATDGFDENEANGSYFKPYNSLEAAFAQAQKQALIAPLSISVMPGQYFTNGNLALPDDCSIVATNGQYSTTFTMNPGYENENCILVGSGCYVQGFAFTNLEVDNFDDPTGGFAIAFRPGARIVRSPYIRDCSQISNYDRQSITAPLRPTNSLGGIDDLGGDDHPNPLVGRGGGVLLADRALLDQDSIFPYMLAFGATPRSPNGIGYCAKNGAGINGIGSITIFQRCAFYALNGGQITLNNSGTQFGDISMRAKGSTPILEPYSTDANNIIESSTFATELRNNANNIIDDLWTHLTDDLGYIGYDSTICRRDVGYILEGVGYDLVLGTNYWSVANGLAYRRSVSSVVINDQLAETSGAISFVKSSVQNLLTHAGSISRTDASFDEIIDILENDEAAANTVIFSDTGVVNQTKARTLLVENKELIQDDIIIWIDENYPDLDYVSAEFRKNIGYIIDGLSHDLNYNCNIATIINAEAYFSGNSIILPIDQRAPTAAAIEQLGIICASIMLGTYTDQSIGDGIATATEADFCIELTSIISDVITENTLDVLPLEVMPDLTWVDSNYIASREIIDDNVRNLQSLTIAFINSEYEFLDEALTRRDAGDLINTLAFDFESGLQTSTRNFVAGLFDYRGEQVFSVFNPSTIGLTYKGSITDANTLSSNTYIDAALENDAYIAYDENASPINIYNGNVFYWDGIDWVDDGPNDTSLIDSFVNAYDRMKSYIIANLTIDGDEQNMLEALIDDVVKNTLTNPSILLFGSLIESIGHQFNLAGAGVNTNALPLNFRRVGTPLAASGSVLQEGGGRVRWSGADELNNQYFARGLKINGRTGRLEGRPFTSSVRRLARRAANSRVTI